jgi:hypothetical protein
MTQYLLEFKIEKFLTPNPHPKIMFLHCSKIILFFSTRNKNTHRFKLIEFRILILAIS